ncbi:MAG TPA: T9SS type A sorting domain-containing protein, partial [Saprospiraceae bacterium]|nr:T9SS type A sorting domain-containing protein [Saprospiraceae bacterium]
PGGLCTSPPSNVVTVYQIVVPPIGVYVAQGQAVLCQGDTAVLAALGVPTGYTYQWLLEGAPLPNAAGEQLTVTEGGNYSVAVTGACGTFTSTAFLVDQEIGLQPVIALGLPDSLFVASGGDCNGCQWYFNNQPLPGATGPYYIVQDEGNYALEVTSPNGCKYRSEEILVIFGNTSVPPSIQSFHLAPNPTKDKLVLTLDMKQLETIEISLHDEAGRQIFLQTQQSLHLNLPIDLHVLPAGTYWLAVKTETGTLTRKVVKI